MMTGLKIVFVANTDWYLANFRFDLACALREQGAEVHCIAPPGKYLGWLTEKGFKTHALDMGDESYSFFDNRRTLRHLKSLYSEIQPDLAHHFTPRCVVLGSMAARKTGVPCIVNALTGLGHVFTSNSLKSKVARPILRRLLKRNLNGENRAVVFQNEDDMEELISIGVVDGQRCHLVRGSGVDPQRFKPVSRKREDDEIRILLASRLIAEKGVHELVDAMRRVTQSHPTAVLWLAGEPYAQNPTSLTDDDLLKLEKLPFVKLLGHLDDIVPVLGQVDIVALPSYREGTPKILLEAASCALPIVATDIPGCRGVVEHGESGFLVPVRDVEQLVRSIDALCGDAELRRKMGRRGREIILGGFTSDIVVGRTLEVYQGLLQE